MNSPTQATSDPLVESVRWLAGWLDREDDLPRWWPVDRLPIRDGCPYRGESDLAAIRDECRWLAHHHPFALSAIENRVSYVVGAGHNYKVRPVPGAALGAEALEACRRELLRWTEEADWPLRQAEMQRRLDRDGEVFLRFFEADGRLVVRTIEPEQVAAPPGRAEAAYGIETDPSDAETVVAYWVRRGESDPPRPVPAAEVQHRKANADRTMPRGVPTLLAVRENLRRVWKLLRNMSTVAGIQAAIAIVRKHAGAAAGSIQQYVSNLATLRGDDGTAAGKNYQQFPPGAIVDTPPGVEYSFPAAGIDAAKYVAAIQAELRAIAARLQMPEFMLSADASNANYASTMVAEGPAVKMFERLQAEMLWHDLAVLRRALRVAERAGRVPPGTTERIEIDAEGPIVQSRNRLAEAQADQILMTLGVASPQTVAARHGLNYDQERDLIDRNAD